MVVGVALVATTTLSLPARDASADPATSSAPRPSGTLTITGVEQDGSTLTAGGVTWTPAPCTASGVCSSALTVSYLWGACLGRRCGPLSEPDAEALVPTHLLGPGDVGKTIEVAATALDVRSDGSMQRRTVRATAATAVAPWPAGQAPRVDFVNGTPEPTTASDQEIFQIGPPHANPADGPVTVTCAVDGAAPSTACQKAGSFETPVLGLGSHTATVVASNAAGSTTTSFSWTVVPLQSPVPCDTCFHPPAVAANGQPMTWDWQLSNANGGLVWHDVDMFDIDGFDNTAQTVAAIHARSGPTLASEQAICYLDMGGWEEYRPDAAQWPAAAIGDVQVGWPQERWVDVRQLQALEPVIDARLEMCAAKGFDGVEIDNIDAWDPEGQSGFPLTAADAEPWLASMADEAHSLGMFVLWKNDPYLASWGVSYFDGAISEQCYQYQECTPAQNAGSNGCGTDSCGVALFQSAGKWVGEVEYGGVCGPTEDCSGRRSFATYCDTVAPEPPAGYGFAAFKAKLALNGKGWYPCWSTTEGGRGGPARDDAPRSPHVTVTDRPAPAR